MFGRTISRVLKSVLDFRNYLSIAKANFVYTNILEDFIQGYILQVGKYPCYLYLKTPLGIQSIELLNSLDTFTVNEIFCWEIYYINREPKVIVDFGSNIGVSEIYFLTRNDKNIVYGFEPVPQLYQQLEKNTAGFASRVFNQNFAVDVESGMANMGIEQSGRYGGIGLIQESQITVKTIAADLAVHKQIDLLKIDIEGVEERVLNSLDVNVLSKIKCIYVESGANDKLMPQNLKQLFQLFSHRGICKYVNTTLIESI